MMPSDPWTNLKQRLDQAAPPLSQQDAIATNSRSMRWPPARLGWVALASTAVLLAAIGIAALSRHTGSTSVKTAGSRSTVAPKNPPNSAAGAGISLPEGTQISSAEIIRGQIWLAVAQNGKGALIVLRTSGEQIRRVALAGEVPVGGLHRVGNRLVFPVIDELGTTGTGIYAVNLAGEPSPARIAPLDRAVDTGTDGTNLWLRGEGLAARVAVAAGKVEKLPVSGFGWIDGQGHTTWTTNRDTQQVLKFEGSQIVAQVRLISPGRVLATAAGVYVTTGSNVVRLDRDSLRLDRTTVLAEPAVTLTTYGHEILALGAHSLTRIPDKGAGVKRLRIDLQRPATALTVDDAKDRALVCDAGPTCEWIELPT